MTNFKITALPDVFKMKNFFLCLSLRSTLTKASTKMKYSCRFILNGMHLILYIIHYSGGHIQVSTSVNKRNKTVSRSEHMQTTEMRNKMLFSSLFRTVLSYD